MDTTNSILIGLSLGFQVTAIFFCIILARKKFLMTAPYVWIGIGLFATTLTRLDNFYHVLLLPQRNILFLINSLFILIGLAIFWINTIKPHE